MKKSLLILAVAAIAAPTYRVVGHIKVGGTGGWDYVYVDSVNHRLYVSHNTRTEVIDTSTDKVIGNIPDTNGVHGIAVATDLGKGFTSNGRDNDVTVFDLKTLKVVTRIKTGQNPDSIIYEPVTHRVFTFNGRSKDSTAIDARGNSVITASIPLSGKPEFSQVDGKGHVFANMEDTNEIIVMEAKDGIVSKRYSIAPCDSPSGLTIDPKGRLYSVCDNKMMIVSDPMAGKVLAQLEIGQGPDGVAFDSGYAFSANGRDGTITMVGETSPGKFAPVATIPTMRGARTIGADQRTHKLYLPVAEMGAPAPTKDGKKGRPQPIPDTFQIIVVGR
ncbi:MAG TPA: YncE family protein [Bryobacteraceae bacterium]|nr:YncE family protein [Bryobacteraceae bacterium]